VDGEVRPVDEKLGGEHGTRLGARYDSSARDGHGPQGRTRGATIPGGGDPARIFKTRRAGRARVDA
jgi:hypothetical protein